MQNKAFALFHLKLGMIVFWGGWFCLAFLTNLFDFMSSMGCLPTDWHFRSGNYALLNSTLHIAPVALNLLFICDTLVQGLAALFFCIAAFCFWQRKQLAWPFINSAFAISIALWAVFLVMEEIFIVYSFESVHSGLFLFELITLMAIHLLPQEG